MYEALSLKSAVLMYAALSLMYEALSLDLRILRRRDAIYCLFKHMWFIRP
jgi:hypothetical protein